ncbi:MAG: polyprenyl synthetase family protein [Planctomycetota bacterium]|nr:MAG: polyprenyl synthetase family protein [Planctomycetota bacterium]
MKQAIRERDTLARQWKRLYAPIAEELSAAEDLLRRELSSDHLFVDGLVKHAFRLGGKRLRPALLLLSAKAIGNINQAHVVLAAVVEMIHTATLVHDDVLDEASLRRHVETVNARSDNEASVLVGDFLFTHAFYLASSLETTYACQTIGRATNIVCAGELRQIHSRGNFELSESEYLSIIEAKTAELCACCCRLGAHYAGADAKTADALDRFGRNLGIAFQIADDMLDLVGDEDSMGKSLGTDLEKQKLTLPVIRLLAERSAGERAEVIELLSSQSRADRNQVNLWLERSDALEYARQKAQDYAAQAKRDIEHLAPSPARDILATLCELVVSRQD